MRSERERQSDTDYQNTDHRGAFSVEPRFRGLAPYMPKLDGAALMGALPVWVGATGAMLVEVRG